MEQIFPNYSNSSLVLFQAVKSRWLQLPPYWILAPEKALERLLSTDNKNKNLSLYLLPL